MDELKLVQHANRRVFPQELRGRPGRVGPRLAAGSRRPAHARLATGGEASAANAAACGPAAFPGQGQAGDLSLPVGRAVADGPLRRQDGDLQPPRDRAARLGADGPANHHDDLGAKELSGRPVDLPLRPVRRERRVAQRALAAHGQHRRRHLHHSLDADRGDQPRPGDHVRADRLSARRPAQHGGLGRLRPGQ